jgi:hypothetical protein
MTGSATLLILRNLLICLLLAFAFLSASCATNDTAQDIWEKYEARGQHKAFAKGSNGVVGAAWAYSSVLRAVRDAVNSCYKHRGIKCRVTHIDGKPYDKDSLTVQEVRWLYLDGRW